MTKHPWTESQDSFIRSNYVSLGLKKCAEHLGTSEYPVYYRAIQLEVIPKPEPKKRNQEPREFPPSIYEKYGYYEGYDTTSEVTIFK